MREDLGLRSMMAARVWIMLLCCGLLKCYLVMIAGDRQTHHVIANDLLRRDQDTNRIRPTFEGTISQSLPKQLERKHGTKSINNPNLWNERNTKTTRQ
jgi:hypothetical protein